MTPAAQLDTNDPWPGLEAFEESAQSFFHGRDSETDELSRHVAEIPVTVLFGKSGLGKTSLLKAGLFPRLRDRQFLPVYVRLEVREGAPALIDQVHDILRTTIAEERIDAPPSAPNETLWQYLHRSDLELWSASNYPLTPVIVFDQFEEVFTLGASVGDAVRRFRLDFGDLAENRIPTALAERLERAGEDAEGLRLRTMPYKVLVSLREDFLPELEGWRRVIPALGRARVRLLPMRYEQAMSAVFETAPHLMDRALAERIVRFVAAEQPTTPEDPATTEPAVEDGANAVEPALLSLFCRGLNERRKREKKARFDGRLLDEAKQGIISDYYRSCVEGLPDTVSEFIENELITEKGFRNSYAKDDAVPAHLTEQQLERLIGRRLLRIEERYGTQRIELTHDVLTGAVREHRDWRRGEEARAAAARQAEEQRQVLAEAARRREEQLEGERRAERERRLESEARAGRRFKILAAALAVALLGAIGMSGFALMQSHVASRESKRAKYEAKRATDALREATRAQEYADRQRLLAEKLLQHIINGIRMKQAVLSGDRTRISTYLASDLANHDIRFTAKADDLGYSNPQNQRVHKFHLFPVQNSLPRGDAAVAVITYRMDNPTFQNTLLTTGAERNFTAFYTGWGCLSHVVVLIEYVDPQRSPQIAEYDMCAALGR